MADQTAWPLKFSFFGGLRRTVHCLYVGQVGQNVVLVTCVGRPSI